MGNEDSSASGKVIKERTVKKRAARSIVAPKADEEITGRDARRREAFAAMNKKPQPVTERDSKVIKTPGGMKTREEAGKSARMVTAPIQLTWNEDTLDPSSKAAKKILATGWPEKPPVPRDGGRENVKKQPQPQTQSQPQAPTGNTQQLPRIPETVEALKEMTGPLPDIKEELKRSTPSQQRYTPEAVRDMQNGALQVRPMKEGPQKGMQDQQRTVAGKPQQGMPQGQQSAQNRQQQVQSIPQHGKEPGEARNRPLAQPQKTGSYGQPHTEVSGLSSVRESNTGNTTVWNPVESQEARTRASNEVAVPMSMRGADKNTAVTTRIDRDAVNSEENRGGRRILKTVVTTTTTTTYETVNDDDLREISTPPSEAGTETGHTAPVRRSAGQPPRRPASRGGQRPGQQPAGQNMRQPVNRPGGPYSQQRPGQNQRPMPQSMQRQGMNGAQSGTRELQNTGAMQQNVMPQNVMQQNGIQQGQQPGGQGSMIDRMMTQPSAGHKPMSAMDKQLADIEKALGLTGDINPEEGGNAPGSEANPAGIESGLHNTGINAGVPVQPQQNDQNPGTQNSNRPSDKPPLNEDVFKGIGTFSKGPNVTINERDVKTNKSAEYTMLAIEGVIFVIILCVCISIYSKIRKSDFKTDIEKSPTEESGTLPDDNDMTLDTGTDGLEVQEAGAGDEIIPGLDPESDADEDVTLTSSSDSVDVDNDNFTLRCTNVTVVLDANNNPAALIYFTFVNKTSKLLSMSEVFPPSVTQNGEPCETFATLNEYPEEFYNKDTQVSDGTSIECCYSVSLKDAVSPLSLTIHDNYETFKDVGTTEIPLQ